MKATAEQIARARRATQRSRGALKPGERVSRTMCLGIKSHFIFTGWDGIWACGRTWRVSDCHALDIYAVNGQPVSFDDPA